MKQWLSNIYGKRNNLSRKIEQFFSRLSALTLFSTLSLLIEVILSSQLLLIRVRNEKKSLNELTMSILFLIFNLIIKILLFLFNLLTFFAALSRRSMPLVILNIFSMVTIPFELLGIFYTFYLDCFTSFICTSSLAMWIIDLTLQIIFLTLIIKLRQIKHNFYVISLKQSIKIAEGRFA
ncbi:MAG: hypothetical protein MHMPM18_003491 [Marteilia pararefringens]